MTDFIPWPGGPCPVPPKTRVDVRFRDKGTGNGTQADFWCGWIHTDTKVDIVAYRIVKEH